MKGVGKYFLFIGCIVLNACVEQVDIEDYVKSKPSGMLVVEGLITNEFKPHYVKLTRTGKALPDEPYESVSGAEITIDDGTFSYPLTETSPGTYETDSIRGEVNKAYTLTININGEVFTATDTMIPVLKFGQAEGIVMGSNTPPKGYVGTPLIVFGSSAPAMVSIEIGNPKATDKYTRLDYYAFPGVDPDDILPKYVEASLAYDEGTQLIQKKYSLSEPHYLFLRALLLETEYKGGIFGSVRANVPTNISGGASGFFGACEMIDRSGTIGKDGKLH
ncbi:MAG TPA: DUF4249 family protein [Cyclobacteriaceae bacterium]